jgi:hypothetical protein
MSDTHEEQVQIKCGSHLYAIRILQSLPYAKSRSKSYGYASLLVPKDNINRKKGPELGPIGSRSFRNESIEINRFDSRTI